MLDLISGTCCIILIILGIILFVAIIIWLVKDRSTNVYTTSQHTYPQQPPPQQTSSRPKGKPCPDCNAPMEYMSEYNRWYCDRCGEYK